MVDIDTEFFELKRAAAHLDLALKAYHAAVRDQIDASRLLEPIEAELSRVIETAEQARAKVRGSLKSPVTAEG